MSNQLTYTTQGNVVFVAQGLAGSGKSFAGAAIALALPGPTLVISDDGDFQPKFSLLAQRLLPNANRDSLLVGWVYCLCTYDLMDGGWCKLRPGFAMPGIPEMPGVMPANTKFEDFKYIIADGPLAAKRACAAALPGQSLYLISTAARGEFEHRAALEDAKGGE